MTIFLGIAVPWLLVGAVWLAVLWRLGRQPLTEIDHRCAQIDLVLSRQSRKDGRKRAHRGDDLVGLRAV